MTKSDRHHVVVVGAGFAGLHLARGLRDEHVRVTLVDQHNYHTFQPLLYQVATSGLDPQDIGHNLRGLFHGRDRVDVRLGEVTDVEVEEHEVVFADGSRLAYDQLVVAAGAVPNDFGVPGVADHGLAMKSLPDATTLRNHVLRRFERASADRSLIADGELTFVISGGGPTGVELAGALAELIDQVLAHDHPDLDVTRSRVLLVEMQDDLLSFYPQALRDYTRDALERRGVEVRTGTTIARVGADRVEFADGEHVATRTLVWAAGVRAHPLADRLGAETVGGGRVRCSADLRVQGCGDVWAIGDVAGVQDADGALLPQLAPVAIQQARHLAAQLPRVAAGGEAAPFAYRDKGTMATIGRTDAVAEVPRTLPLAFAGRGPAGAGAAPALHLSGFLAWLAWLALHLVQLVGFRNRVSVLLNWGWNYVTWEHGARLIFDTSGVEAPHADDPPIEGDVPGG